MDDPIFKSILSIEEIEENFKEIDVFSGIMDGLQEVLSHVQDKEA